MAHSKRTQAKNSIFLFYLKLLAFFVYVHFKSCSSGSEDFYKFAVYELHNIDYNKPSSFSQYILFHFPGIKSIFFFLYLTVRLSDIYFLYPLYARYSGMYRDYESFYSNSLVEFLFLIVLSGAYSIYTCNTRYINNYLL